MSEKNYHVKRKINIRKYKLMAELFVRHSKKTIYLFLSIIILPLITCKEEPERRADAPAQQAFQKIPEIPGSTINVPIHLDFTQLEQMANEKLPWELINENTLHQPDGHKIKATREQVTFQFRDSLLNWHLPIKFDVCKKFSFLSEALCCDGKFTQKFDTRIHLSTDWQLISTTSQQGRNWHERCRINNIGGSLIDNFVTAIIDRGLNSYIGKEIQLLDQQIEEFGDLRPYLVDIWSDIQEPVRVQDSVWLLFSPEKVNVSALDGQGKTVSVTVTILAKTRLRTGKVPNIETVALPERSGQVKGKGFQLAVEADLSYSKATQMLSRKLVGESYSIKGEDIKITGIHLFGSGKFLIIKTKLEGDFKGTIYLKGRPKFDAATKAIYLDSLDFDLQTENLLVKTADWLLHEEFRHIVETKTRWEIKNQLAEAEKLIENGLNRNINPQVSVQGSLNHLSPLGVYVTQNSLKAIIIAKGDAFLSLY